MARRCFSPSLVGFFMDPLMVKNVLEERFAEHQAAWFECPYPQVLSHTVAWPVVLSRCSNALGPGRGPRPQMEGTETEAVTSLIFIASCCVLGWTLKTHAHLCTQSIYLPWSLDTERLKFLGIALLHRLSISARTSSCLPKSSAKCHAYGIW